MTTLEGPIEGTQHLDIGGLSVDESQAGDARMKRVMYPLGWRWRTSMQPISGTDWCMHAHIGFLAQGAMTVEYSDGCKVVQSAPAFVVIEPGHDGWVVGDEPVVLFQVDCGVDTVSRFGMVGEHRHD